MIKKFTLAALFFSMVGIQAQTSYTFSGKPTYQILAIQQGTTLGTINIELFPTIAPLHTINFDSLNSFQFFDTTAFHRVVPNFVIQGGDPNSRHGPTNTWGMGDPNQPTVNAEFSQLKHVRGIISMARKGGLPNSGTSQFFICMASNASLTNLNGQYSIFGRVTSGMNVADLIVNTPRNLSNDMPLQKIEMFVTRTGSNDTIPNTPVLTSPADSSIAVDTNFVQVKWQMVPGAYLYHVEISRDDIFFDTIKTVTTPNLFTNINYLTGNTPYYWRVRSNNGGNYSPWSPTFMFHTKGQTTGITSYSQRKNAVLVYPNPGTGKFNFSQLEPGSKIEISDLSGRLIYQTVATETHSIIDLQEKDKGVYLYQISHPKKGYWQGKLVVK